MESPLCPADTRLIETFAWNGSGFARLGRHLARARMSANTLGFVYDSARIHAALASVTGPAPRRIRLTLGKNGDAEVTTTPLAPPAPHWRVLLAPTRLSSATPLLRHKTTARALYDQTRATLPPGIDEAIFANERGALCEGTITSLFFDIGHGLATPPLAAGCLPGILRAELLETGRCHEADLALDSLPHARLWLGNALRGLIPTTLIRPH